MRASVIITISALVVAGLALPSAVAQTNGDEVQDANVPNSTFNSVSQGALIRRAPGNWNMRLNLRSPDITQPKPPDDDMLDLVFGEEAFRNGLIENFIMGLIDTFIGQIKQAIRTWIMGLFEFDLTNFLPLPGDTTDDPNSESASAAPGLLWPHLGLRQQQTLYA